MFGAIIGDIIGSRFEWNNIKTKDFELFSENCFFTDDTVMTIAVAKALLNCDGDYSYLSEETIKELRNFGRLYPDCGYGGMFKKWLTSKNPQPYHSFGNGAAMRISAVSLAGRCLEDVKALSKMVTQITHNHPEGIKGAEAVAVAVYLARKGSIISEIKAFIQENYYDYSFTLDDIRDHYYFNETCQGTVPQALQAFFESTSFEDAIRNAVSIGGDSDTLCAITGSIAETYYGIPNDLLEKGRSFLDRTLLNVIDEFYEKFTDKDFPLEK